MQDYNKGTLALHKNKLDKALQFFKREKMEFKELYLNMGNTYRLLGNSEKAWELYCKANSEDILDLDGVGGEYANALSNMGLIAYQNDEDEIACSLYNRTLALDPLHYMTIWNYSLALLRIWCSGSLLHKDAWKMHEYRFKTVTGVSPFSLWDGSYVDTLTVVNEQGMGDKLMYGRYIDLLKPYCRKLVVQCPAEMDCFFENTSRIVEGVGIPFASLPSRFGVVDGDWLRGRFNRVGGLRIAVEWSGNKTHLNDRNRSCFSSYFSDLARDFGDIEFVNVRPDSSKVRYITKDSGDWTHSASVISSCDLVISVDTSLVHLAGSLGVECWMIQPLMDTDFRWGNPRIKRLNKIDTESNIWYNNVRVIENNGWDKVFLEIRKRLNAKYGRK
jgi:hypothetical protein